MVKKNAFDEEPVREISSMISSPVVKNNMQLPSFYLQKEGSNLMLGSTLEAVSALCYSLSDIFAANGDSSYSYFCIGVGFGSAVGALLFTISGISNIRKAGNALGAISLNMNGVTVRF